MFQTTFATDTFIIFVFIVSLKPQTLCLHYLETSPGKPSSPPTKTTSPLYPPFHPNLFSAIIACVLCALTSCSNTFSEGDALQ